MEMSQYRAVALDMYRTLHRSFNAHIPNASARNFLKQRAASQFRLHSRRTATPAQAEALLRRAHAVLLASLPEHEQDAVAERS